MRMLILLMAIMPSVSMASGWYECTDSLGRLSQQIDRCARGETSRFVPDAEPARTYRLGENGPVTIQIAKVGAHFGGIGSINGVPVRMMVDTGATAVAMSSEYAKRAGISLVGARSIAVTTANGTVSGLLTVADSVEFFGMVQRNVSVVVHTGGVPFPGILLGMSYLSRYDVSMHGSVMSLTRR